MKFQRTPWWYTGQYSTVLCCGHWFDLWSGNEFALLAQKAARQSYNLKVLSSNLREGRSLFQGFPDSSVGKESTCNAGDPCLIPRSGRSPGEGIGYLSMGFPGGSAGKESACKAGDLSSVPGLGRSPGEGKATTPGFWPGEFHRLYSPWGHKESDTTE